MCIRLPAGLVKTLITEPHPSICKMSYGGSWEVAFLTRFQVMLGHHVLRTTNEKNSEFQFLHTGHVPSVHLTPVVLPDLIRVQEPCLIFLFPWLLHSLQTSFLFCACTGPMMTSPNGVFRLLRLHLTSLHLSGSQLGRDKVIKTWLQIYNIWARGGIVQATRYMYVTQCLLEHRYPTKCQWRMQQKSPQLSKFGEFFLICKYALLLSKIVTENAGFLKHKALSWNLENTMVKMHTCVLIIQFTFLWEKDMKCHYTRVSTIISAMKKGRSSRESEPVCGNQNTLEM